MISSAEVFTLIEEALGLESGSVNIESSSKNIAEWDSLGHFAILSALDEKYGSVSVTNEKIAKATSAKELIKALES